MNNENRKVLWKLIQQTGDSLLGKLPSHPNHPQGRNPYAHVASRVKGHFKKSYKDLPDDCLEKVVEYLEQIKREEG